MKKYYLPLAFLVLILGGFLVWVIIDRLPDWMGTTRNQHSFIDQLEQQGIIDFKARSIEDQSVQLAQFKGKIVILSFWASWCGPCVEEFPSMVSLLKKFPDKLVMVAVSSDYTREDIDVFLKSLNLTEKLSNLHIVWDPDHEISQKYQVQKLPESFIFRQDQKLLRKVIGSIKWDDADAVGFFKANM
jgi:thiol-disulfide isomerase/thioredoxin